MYASSSNTTSEVFLIPGADAVPPAKQTPTLPSPYWSSGRVSLCSLGCIGSVDQTHRYLPGSASQVLELKVCATTPGFDSFSNHLCVHLRCCDPSETEHACREEDIFIWANITILVVQYNTWSDILKMCSKRKSCIPETRVTAG